MCVGHTMTHTEVQEVTERRDGTSRKFSELGVEAFRCIRSRRDSKFPNWNRLHVSIIAAAASTPPHLELSQFVCVSRPLPPLRVFQPAAAAALR